MGYWSLTLTIILYFSEAFYFHSTDLNFYVVFPGILNSECINTINVKIFKTEH
jgi:hypothetical protein